MDAGGLPAGLVETAALLELPRDEGNAVQIGGGVVAGEAAQRVLRRCGELVQNSRLGRVQASRK